jgi:hypothetical protein
MKEQSQTTIPVEEVRRLAESKVPGRIDSRRTSALLGFAEHDIPVLVSARLLKPLGKPAQNGVKWYSTEYIVKLSRDGEWLDKATATVQRYWKQKRSRRSGEGPSELPENLQ